MSFYLWLGNHKFACAFKILQIFFIAYHQNFCTWFSNEFCYINFDEITVENIMIVGVQI